MKIRFKAFINKLYINENDDSVYDKIKNWNKLLQMSQTFLLSITVRNKRNFCYSFYTFLFYLSSIEK